VKFRIVPHEGISQRDRRAFWAWLEAPETPKVAKVVARTDYLSREQAKAARKLLMTLGAPVEMDVERFFGVERLVPVEVRISADRA
jgi:hypothetical protein